MDIAGLSMALAKDSLLSKVGIAVLDKTLDMNKVMGQELTDIIDAAAMELSVNPAVGANIDISI